MRSRTEPHALCSPHRLLPAHLPTACSYLRRPTTSEGLSGLDQSSARTQSNGTDSAALQAGAAPATPLRCPAHLPMHTQGTIRALGGTRLGWEPGLHWLRAHPPAPGCGPTELSTARGYLLVPFSFPLLPLFSLSSTWDGDRRVACPFLCNGMQGAATSR